MDSRKPTSGADAPDTSTNSRPPMPADLAGDSPRSGPVALYSTPTNQPIRRKKVRLHHLAKMKSRGERITAVTCYDATFAQLVEAAGVDIVLVGDSLGNVIQGQTSTLPVTVEHVIYHCQAVGRGLRCAHLVADMPFMSFRSADVALVNAGRLMAEGGAHAVKLEGGVSVVPVVTALVASGIPVMGHVGLTPQSVHALGGHRVQGKGVDGRERVLSDALALQDAGCYAVVLEGIPAALAAEISASLSIPTIGIGAGPQCDGQILVLYDMLGLNPDFKPKFLKRFAEIGEVVVDALKCYQDEVRQGSFPAQEHCYEDPTEPSKKASLKVAR